MLTVKIIGWEEIKRGLSDIAAKQIPFAAAQAITKTAKSVEARVQSDMAAAFHTASPYVKRATFSTYASKKNLSATVGLKDQKPSGGTAPAVLLKEHFTGGPRGNKPFEKALITMGVMPAGYRAIPGSGIKKDAYGNPSRKEIGEMLGALRSGFQVWKGRGKKVVLTGYFVILVDTRSRLAPGIYRRINKGVIAPMFIFVNKAAYHKAIDLQHSANEVVQREFQPNFDKAFVDALRTAR